MIIVHHLENSRSHRVLWLLEELGVSYEIKLYKRDPVTMLAPPALRAVHPLGKSPVIVDGAITLGESGAIVEYLVEKYPAPAMAPARGTAEWARYLYWLHFAEGTAMPSLLLKLVLHRMATAPPWPIRPIVAPVVRRARDQIVTPRLAENLDLMEAELNRSTWFAGEAFSAADIQMSYPIEASVRRAGLDARRPKLMAYLQRIRERPAYRRAAERGGPGGPPAA
ncbi:MAG: glutathione S-transferase [Bradyrhizobium sp.]|nr:MAG: glutathione S-transferase [Bradyrhizobium sp.]